jgi:uncharacterized delta-60 repeat protein
MGEPYPSIEFTINFQPPVGNLPYSSKDIAGVMAQWSTWIPIDVGTNIVRYQNGKFTLYGKKALYFKSLIDNGLIANVTYGESNQNLAQASLICSSTLSCSDFILPIVSGIASLTCLSNLNATSSVVALRTGFLPQTFIGQQPHSWGEALGSCIQNINGTDYLLVVGICDYTGIYTGGEGIFVGVDFDWIISRYRLDNGEPDSTFGTYGMWRISAGSSDDELSSVIIDNNGKIVVCGFMWEGTTPSQQQGVMRFHADGSIDLNFGTYGTIKYFPETARYQCSHVGFQSNHKIITYSNHNSSGANRTRVARFHLNGALDTGFGKVQGVSSLGYLEIWPNLNDTEASNYYGHLIILDDDRLVVSGRVDIDADGNYQGFVARILANGSSTDSTFGIEATTGIYLALVDFPPFNDTNLNGITLMPGNKILASGSARRDATGNQDGVIALFDSSGNLDTSFNGTGKLAALNNSTLVSEYYFQPIVTSNGTFRFFGMSSSFNHALAETVSPTAHLLAVGYTSTGALDTSWAGNGVFEDLTNPMATFFDVLQMNDGRVIGTGHQAYPSTTVAQALIVKFKANGTLDTTFGALASPPPSPTAPTVTTGSVTNITSTSALLAGTVNPNGTSTTCHFEYGLTNNYLQKTTETNVGSDSSVHPISVNITGLLPGKIYHYRLVAYNGSVGLGADDTFTTSAGTLTLLSDSMTNVDGTDLRDHTGYAQIDLTGSAYKQVSGIGQIQNNKAVFISDPDHPGAGTKRWYVQHDVGYNNVTITANITWNGANDGNNRPTGLIARAQSTAELGFGNEDNFLLAGWDIPTGTFSLRTLISGAFNIFDTIPFTPTQGVPHTITLNVSGNTTTASITGGSRSLTGDLTGAIINNNTYCGWYFNRGLGDSIKDLVVTTP